MSDPILEFFNSLLPDTISLANIKDDRPKADPDYGIAPPYPGYLNSPSYFDSRITNSSGSLLLNSPGMATDDTLTLAQKLQPTFSYNSWCGDVILPIPPRPQNGDPTNPNFSYIDANGNNNWDIGNIPGVDDIRVYNNVAVVSSYLSNEASTYASIFHSSPAFIPDTSPDFIPDTPFFADVNNDGYAAPLQRINWLFNFVIEPQQVIAANTTIAGTSGNFSLGYATYFVDLDGVTGGYTPADADGLNGIDANDFFSLGDVQLAIWKLLGQAAGPTSIIDDFAAPSAITSDARAETLFDLAWDNGSSFVPGARQDAVVILHPLDETIPINGILKRQPILIEVEVPGPNSTTAKIEGYKWLDADANRVWDNNDNEKGLEQWKIYLDGDADRTNNNNLAETTTNEDGLYGFSLSDFLTEATTRTFYVWEDNPSGWTNTYDGSTKLEITTIVSSNQVVISKVVVNDVTEITDPLDIPLALSGANGVADPLNFGNFQNFSISGTKYRDQTGNGIIGDDDVGLGGVTIYIDANVNGSFDNGELSTTTASNGTWSITNLGPDTNGMLVREVVPAGYTPTVGANGLAIVNPGSGGTQTELNFANYLQPTIPAPGAGTPGFWGNNNGRPFWDGILNNEAKRGQANFAAGDLFHAPYTVQAPANPSNAGKVLDPLTNTWTTGVLIGDFNRNGATDAGENTIFFTTANALSIINSSNHAIRNDKRLDLGRHTIAGWLNFLSGNPIDLANPSSPDIRDYLGEAVEWLKLTSNSYGDILGAGSPVAASSSAWQSGFGSGQILGGTVAGNTLLGILDGYNNGSSLYATGNFSRG
jgi:hypothetical protein